jgi:Tfp pilus assembly protein PilN
MLRTNLATRPFYNDRAVRLGLLVAIVVVVGLTVFNVLQAVSLNARSSELTARLEEAERQTVRYREEAQAIRAALKSDEMTVIQNAAREANALIGRRVFSWTELFNQFERTLPADVRISDVTPQVDTQGRLLVAITVLSRSPEDLNEFMDQLESSGTFRDVLNRQDSILEDGLTRSIVQGYYVEPPASETAPTSEAGAAANATPSVPVNGTAAAPEGAR